MPASAVMLPLQDLSQDVDAFPGNGAGLDDGVSEHLVGSEGLLEFSRLFYEVDLVDTHDRHQATQLCGYHVPIH